MFISQPIFIKLTFCAQPFVKKPYNEFNEKLTKHSVACIRSKTEGRT